MRDTQSGQSWYILHHLDTDSIIAEMVAGDMACNARINVRKINVSRFDCWLSNSSCYGSLSWHAAVQCRENWFISRNIWLSPGSNIPQMSNSFCCEQAKFQQNISPYLIILDWERTILYLAAVCVTHCSNHLYSKSRQTKRAVDWWVPILAY